MGKIKCTQTGIEGLFVIEPTVFYDERGYFIEAYNQRDFFEAGLTMQFVQDNESRSVSGVIRALHFQSKHPQGKLVRAIEGEVYDVAVDIREGSPTFGKWYGLYLSAENKKQFYIPPGFAHGFLVTSEHALFAYKCTDYYYPDDQCGIIYNDPALGIDWPLDRVTQIILNEKDKLYGGIDILHKALHHV